MVLGKKKRLEWYNLRFLFCFLRKNAEFGVVFWHSGSLFPGSDSTGRTGEAFGTREPRDAGHPAVFRCKNQLISFVLLYWEWNHLMTLTLLFFYLGEMGTSALFSIFWKYIHKCLLYINKCLPYFQRNILCFLSLFFSCISSLCCFPL